MYIRFMVRTQIYLTKSLKDYYQNLASKNNTTLAAQIRQALEVLKADQKKNVSNKRASTSKGDRLLAMAREVSKIKPDGKVPTDLALNHDKYLYGKW